MTTSNIVTYAKKNDPVKQVYVTNADGYFDLIVNKTKNGKAIRIGQRFGEPRVHITMGEVDNLIEALQLIKAQGVSVSVSDLELDAA
jgi:hypothetical protein